MKKRFLSILIILSIALFFSNCGSDDSTSSASDAATNGKVTVELTGAAAHNGKQFQFATFASGDSLDNLDGDPTGSGGTAIAEGIASGVISTDDEAKEEISFESGTTISVVGIIDIDDSQGEPTEGDFIVLEANVEIDGDTTVTFDFADMTVVPGGGGDDATCSDGVKNQDETAIDCGGATCDACVVPETCSDNTQNQDETGVDCGGLTSGCGVCTLDAAYSGLEINEVSSSTLDGSDDYVEIVNNSSATIDIAGSTFTDNSSGIDYDIFRLYSVKYHFRDMSGMSIIMSLL